MPELDALCAWFVDAIERMGHGSIRRTAELSGLNQRSLYDAVNGGRMLPLRLVRALAEGLGQDPAEAERLWAEAKRQRDRSEEQERQQGNPAPLSWAELPLPSAVLRDLLDAQDVALDCLPYSFLGLAEPALSAVHVRQSVRYHPASETERPEPGTEPGQTRRVNIGSGRGALDAPTDSDISSMPGKPYEESAIGPADALARHEHLLITGEAGAGKSTLASYLVRVLGGIWLRRTPFHLAPTAEPVVPLRVAASHLAGASGSWSEALRSAVLQGFRHGLVAGPPVDLFGQRPHGVRWLICVDGLDEVTDLHRRADLIRTLARHARADSDFRLLVSSRPLPAAELAPLLRTMGTYEVQPFGRAELREYAHRWFEQQRSRVVLPESAARRFLRETAEGQLAELVRNPLLATIALVAATLEPGRPLPSSRTALYQSFVDLLRDRREAAPVEHSHVWCAETVDEYVRTLARLRVEGGDDLLATARKLVRDQASDGLPAGWEIELPTVLARTGLLVVEGEDVRFLHQTFAEYLAAEDYAEELAAAGPDAVEPWVRRACIGDRRTLARFVLGRRVAGESAGALLEQVLARYGPERTLLAGSLLADGVDPGPLLAGEVIRRLTALVCGDDEDHSRAAALGLAALHVFHPTAEVLRSLVDRVEIDTDARLGALQALSGLVSSKLASQLLTSLLETLYGALPQAAVLAEELGESSREDVRRRLVDAVGEPDADAWEWTIVAGAYRTLGFADGVEQAARRVLGDPLATANQVGRVAGAWLECAGESAAVAEISRLAHARSGGDAAGRMAIAHPLERAGGHAEASELALEVLESDLAAPWHLDAAELLLRTRGPAGGEPVLVRAVRARTANGDLWRTARLLKLLVGAGVECDAAGWAREQLGRSGSELPFGSADAVALLIAAEGPSAVLEAEALDLGTRLNYYERITYAEALVEADEPARAFRVAESILRLAGVRSLDFQQAAAIGLKIDRARLLELLLELIDTEHASGDWAAGVLKALTDDGAPDLDAYLLRLSRRLLAMPGTESAHVESAIGTLCGLLGPDDLPEVAELVCHHPQLAYEARRRLTRMIAASGGTATALTIWRYQLSVRGRSRDTNDIQILEDIAQLTSHQTAGGLVQEQLDAQPAPSPFRRARLERMLNWLAAGPMRA